MTSKPAPDRSTRQLTLPVRRCYLLTLLALAGLAAVLLALRIPSTNPQRSHEIAPEIVWSFEQSESGAMISAPLANENRIYVAAIRDNALAPSGVVYCLDRRRGTPLWTFDNDGAMRHTFSSPCLAGGRLYIGEGINFEHRPPR